MDETDDFGDLYADLDVTVAIGIAAIDASENEKPSSISEKHSPVDPTGEAGRKGEPKLEVADANWVGDSSESSDSEDDLHIVLNDEHCPKFSPGQRVAFANGLSDGEDQSDDPVRVTGADGMGKDQKRGDQLRQPGDGPAQGGGERGGVAMGGFRNWPVGSHSVGFPINVKSLSGRGDWDNSMMPCTGGTASFKSGIATSAGFSLPRHRTIFDIDIEDFQQKPWRDNGVDITDYFNFGLDEESWKNYCKHLDLFRQQDTPFRYPVYGPSRVHESEIVSAKALSYDAARGCTETILSPREPVDNGGKGFEPPRGRAIRVEGGFGDRTPSADMRRPRFQDSDVVIEITVDDSLNDASVPCEELNHTEQTHIDCSILKSDDNLHKSLTLDHDREKTEETANHIEHNYPVKDIVLREDTLKDKSNLERGDEADPSIAAASMVSDESASRDQTSHNSASSDLRSNCKASMDGCSLENSFSPGRRTSLSSDSGLQKSFNSDFYPSKGFRSIATKTEQEDSEDNTPECSFPIGGQKYYSGTRRQRTTRTHACSKKAPTYRNHQKVSYSMEVGYHARNRDSDCEVDHYRKIGISQRYNARGDFEKQIEEKQFAKDSLKRFSHETSVWRNQHERDYLKRSVCTRGNGMKQRECYRHEKYRHVKRGVSREEASQPLTSETHSNFQQKMERKSEHWIRMRTEYDDILFEERYREHQPESDVRHLSYFDREEQVRNRSYVRDLSHTVRDLRNTERRYKYELDPIFDLHRTSRYVENDAKNWRYYDQRLLDSEIFREHTVVDDRDWPDDISPTNRLRKSRKSGDSRTYDKNFPNVREIESKDKNVGYFLVQSSKDRRASCEEKREFYNNDRIIEENDLYVETFVSGRKRRCNRLAKPSLCHNEIKFKHQERDDPVDFSFDESLRHVKSRVSQNSYSGQKFSDDHLLSRARKNTLPDGCSGSDSREHVSFVSEFFDMGSRELEVIEPKEAVDVHVNGWKGKFPKGSKKVARESGGQSDVNHKRNKRLQIAEQRGSVFATKDVPSLALKTERTPILTSVQAERLNCHTAENLSNDVLPNYSGKNTNPPHDDDDEIEEGQLIEDSDYHAENYVMQTDNSDKRASPVEAKCVAKNRLSDNTACNNKSAGGYDNHRILETLAKMEKRRERFKEPITLKQISEKIQDSPSEAAVADAVEEVQKQRPARKRRWACS